ncbi:GNAT family N-acetyltransferase [Nonomuraea sp. NPDC050310]|uniref:GNAT family N-acetyltransferase n=1 Tax=Nonomuraea sp. NPDC050310 TaxID=3154935 RepID=UPI0033FAF04F
MPRTVETARMLLRPFAAGDADELFALDNDPEVMRHISKRPVSREEVERELRWFMRPGEYGFWAAEERAGGGFLGWFHLRPREEDPPGHAELGYRLRRSAWGRGYATEGAIALVALAFGELGAERVYAEGMAAHTASRRVMEKAGLRYVRTFDAGWPEVLDGAEEGDVEYEALRADWRPTG